MAEYQNIFTQVQVQGPPEMGLTPTASLARDRTKSASFSTLAGLFGNAQLGPIHLGPFGLVSIATGSIWFFIVGMSFWAQVDYSPALFLRELFWLSLEPPAEEYGLGFAPLNEGGWWLISSFFLLVSVISWWIRTYLRAEELGMGKHVSCSFMARLCCLRCTVRPFLPSAALVVNARSSRSSIVVQPPSGQRCSGAGPWALTPPWRVFTVGRGGLRY